MSVLYWKSQRKVGTKVKMINRIKLISLLIVACQSIQAQVAYIQPDITRVLVNPETNNTHVFYTGTDHPDAHFYLLLKWIPASQGSTMTSGEEILSSYQEENGSGEYEVILEIPEVTEHPVGFSVTAYQDHDSPLTNLNTNFVDSTIHLSVTYDSCQSSARLHWNDYNAWRGRILRYQVFMKISDENIEGLGIFPEEVNDTILYNLPANNNYLFFIQARRSNLFADEYVTSNGVMIETPHAVYPEYIRADYGTVGEGNHPVVQFSVDPASELSTFALLRSADPLGTFDTITYLSPVNDQIVYTDTDVDASARPYYYKLLAINYCNQAITELENLAATICLKGQQDGNTVTLSWNEYLEWPAGVEYYLIERSFEGEPYEEVASVPASGIFLENMDSYSGQGHSGYVCYRVTAFENGVQPGNTLPFNSTSNLFCANLPLNIRFEFNAFVPGLIGFASFGPTMEFLPSQFDFKIYNRTGTVVFHSDDPNNPRWDGRLPGGGYAPEGVYRYQVKYEDESGRTSYLNGNVTVVSQ